MAVAIVLGNRLNDDNSLSEKGLKRCEILQNAMEVFHFSKVILTGGIANPKTSVSEAKAMKDHLVDLGMKEDLFLLEEEAKSTTENALFSLKIVKELGEKDVVVISSIEHFARSLPKNAIVCFREAIRNFPDMKLKLYTEDY